MGPALRQPLIDLCNLYLRQVAGLLGCQHLAVKPADTTVRRGHSLDDPLLLEKSNLNSSSFCCRHRPVVESKSPLLVNGAQSAEKLPDNSRSDLEKNRK